MTPVARSRITRTVDWLPALPPAPTSMVKNRVMTKLSSTSAAYRWRMMELWDQDRASHFRAVHNTRCHTVWPCSAQSKLNAHPYSGTRLERDKK